MAVIMKVIGCWVDLLRGERTALSDSFEGLQRKLMTGENRLVAPDLLILNGTEETWIQTRYTRESGPNS